MSAWSKPAVLAPAEHSRDHDVARRALVRAVRIGAAVAVRVALRLYTHIEIAGRELLPAHGPFVLVANHASHLDGPAVLAALPLGRLETTYPLAANDYFFESAWRRVVASVLFNSIPFDREAAAFRSLERCGRLLERGDALVAFPEGTRSHDGRVGEFKAGVGLLLAGSDVPAIPCYVEGAHRAWPKGARLPRPRKLRVRIGAPMRFADLPRGKSSAVRVAEELRRAVIALRDESARDEEKRR